MKLMKKLKNTKNEKNYSKNGEEIMYLKDKIKHYKKIINSFKITNTIKNNDMTIITGNTEYSSDLHFIYYKNYLICCGDYGEWTFQFNNSSNIITFTDPNYIFEKVSNTCDKLFFNNTTVEEDIKNWFKEFKKDYANEGYNFEIAQTLIDQLLDNYYGELDKYRLATTIDEFMQDFSEQVGYDFDDDFELYSAGEEVNDQLAINIGIILKISGDEYANNVSLLS